MTRKCLEFHQASQISQNRGRGGFSAAELLVVVAMLAILATVSLPIFAATFKNARLSGAVRQLASDIRSARSLAVSKGGFYGIHTDGNRYRIVSSLDVTTWTSPTVITNWMDLSREFCPVSAPPCVTIESVGSVLPIGGPIFNAIGASVDSSKIVRSVNITLADDSVPKVIKVIQVSPAGNVKMP
jgi:prepilin-type N-terminal cleavage/methylation domain-containing protein